MEIKITSLFSDDSAFVPFDLSNNRATLGDNAGRLTWQASKECATATQPPLLDTDEKKEAFRDFVRDSGGWTREEIAVWDDTELNALFLQWVAGDVREAFDDADFADWDWEQYEKDAETGRISSRLFKNGNDVYFYIGN
jgi:hypothetical protein